VYIDCLKTMEDSVLSADYKQVSGVNYSSRAIQCSGISESSYSDLWYST
jgi:hypothetical protein